MNILVTLDSNYVFPLTVLLKSLMITNSEVSLTFMLHIHLLLKKISEKLNRQLTFHAQEFTRF